MCSAGQRSGTACGRSRRPPQETKARRAKRSTSGVSATTVSWATEGVGRSGCAGSRNARDGGDGRTGALRCFANDGSRRLVAGLYPTDVADHDDHWAHAEPLTTEADAALARQRAHAGGRRTADPVGALLGSALERLQRGSRRYATVPIPASLTPGA